MSQGLSPMNGHLVEIYVAMPLQQCFGAEFSTSENAIT